MNEALVRVDEHLEQALAGISRLAPLELLLGDAHGCILAEDVHAAVDLPPFDNSAMDGYAVRVSDVAASMSEQRALVVVGDIAAGATNSYSVQPGMSMRIMTGAPVPPGADAVVPLEWTDRGIRSVRFDRAPTEGQYIRRRGEDVQSGEVVLRSGARLGAAQVALLAAVGRQRVLVHPRPRVVILSTGSELVEPGDPLQHGQIHESNSFMLAAAAREAGATPYNVGIVPDDPTRLLGAIEDQLIRADLVITTGGVSVGAYDVVKEVLSRLGTVQFAKVAMQPGMPQGFGTIGPDSTPIFTLPGNPVSAYVSFEVFVRPVLRRMLGVEPLSRPTVRAVLGAPLRSPMGKRQFVRARLDVENGRYVASPVGGPGSHLLADLAAANALIVVPEEIDSVQAGDTVTVMVLERRAA